MGPKCHYIYPYKTEEERDQNTQRKGQVKMEQRDLKMLALNIRARQPQAKTASSPQELEEAKSGFPMRTSRGDAALLRP